MNTKRKMTTRLGMALRLLAACGLLLALATPGFASHTTATQSIVYQQKAQDVAPAEPQAWTAAEPIPEPSAATVVQCNDDPDGFYLVGGVITGTVVTDTLNHYDAVSDSWMTPSLASLPQPRNGVAATCYQDKIYAAGGANSGIFNSFYIYDIASNSWSTGSPLPDSVWGAALTAWNGKLYLVGGTRVDSTFKYMPVDRVDVYDIASGTWTAGGGTPMPTAASFFSNVQRGPYLFAVGGFSGDYDFNVSASQRYDMSSDTWEFGPTFSSQRAGGGISMTGSRLYAAGGDLNGGGRDDTTDLVEYLDLAAWPGGPWTDLGDPLPQPNWYPAGACTNTMTGGETWAVGGVDISASSWVFYDTNLYRPAEPCPGYNYALSLAPDSQSGGGARGGTVDYTLTVTNTGDTPDAYTSVASSTWTATISGLDGALDPGQSQAITVTVEIPAGAAFGDSDTATITVSSQGDPGQSEGAKVTTTNVVPEYGVVLAPVSLGDSAYPGEMVTYTLTLSNTGDITDTFDLTYAGNLWGVHLPVTQTTLAAGAHIAVSAQVMVPANAPDGDMDSVTITATSQADPSASDSSDLITTIWWRAFLPVLPQDYSDSS